MRTATISIHQQYIADNITTLKSLAPSSQLLAMVKADAYGHGIGLVVPAMEGANGFGVAFLQEALAVRHILPKDTRPIVLMQGVFSFDEWQQVIEQDFVCMVHCDEQVAWALQALPSPTSNTNTIWLKYNTGMNRLGFDEDKVVGVAKMLLNQGYHLVLTSHFACADDKESPINTLQIKRFQAVLLALQSEFGDRVKASLCNSAGVVNFGAVHYDWVRIGIALYGSSPVVGRTAFALGLKPAMSLTAKLMAIHDLKQGDCVGYGATWRANRECRIGVVSLGYGDGYPRVVHGAKVMIGCQLVSIVGRVAMDMLMVDLSDSNANVGDVVLLWGEGQNGVLDIDAVADWAGTIGYELMCRLTARPVRCVV